MIEKVVIRDARYPIATGAGSDAVHRNPVYSYAVTALVDDSGAVGQGLAFTVGAGHEIVCQAAAHLAANLPGRDMKS